MPNDADLKLLDEKWRALTANEFQEWSDHAWPPKHSTQTVVVIVTDASEPRWSWLEMEKGEVANGLNPNGEFPTHVAGLAIYYKELFTVLVAFRALQALGRIEIDITLVGDSQAVIGSINRKMGPEGAWWMIDEIVAIVTENRWGLALKWVESDGNVAHSATHLEKITQYRTQRSWLVSQSDEYPPADGGNAKRDREGALK